MLILRPYHTADAGACLQLFDDNTPAFFSPTERADFANFLACYAEQWRFQVIERDARIVACGGYAVNERGDSADLCWGMVARDLHGTGLGKTITLARLQAACAAPGIHRIRLDTSQHTQGFYARLGFRPTRIIADGYDKGLDRWEMELAVSALHQQLNGAGESP